MRSQSRCKIMWVSIICLAAGVICNMAVSAIISPILFVCNYPLNPYLHNAADPDGPDQVVAVRATWTGRQAWIVSEMFPNHHANPRSPGSTLCTQYIEMPYPDDLSVLVVQEKFGWPFASFSSAWYFDHSVAGFVLKDGLWIGRDGAGANPKSSRKRIAFGVLPSGLVANSGVFAAFLLVISALFSRMHNTFIKCRHRWYARTHRCRCGYPLLTSGSHGVCPECGLAE